MDGNSHHGASRNLSYTIGSQFVFGLLADIDVASDFGSTTRVHNVLCDLRVANDGRVLLAWRDRRAVASKVLVNCQMLEDSPPWRQSETHTQEALTLTRVANGCENDSMSVYVCSKSDQRESGSRVIHCNSNKNRDGVRRFE